MDYAFIDSIRLQLESSNIFMYSIQGAKMCAILLLLFSVLERWGKNILSPDNGIDSLFTILGFIFLIMSSDYFFNMIESTFSSISTTMQTVEDSVYTDLLFEIRDDYEAMNAGAEDWMDYIGVFFGNIGFFVGYMVALLLVGIVKIADMAMVTGYLLTRVFFLEIMKFLFPIAVALSTLKQTSGLIGKWLKLYIGVSVLGIIYIGIIKLCSITQLALQAQFKNVNNDGMFDSYMSMNLNVWSSLVTIIVVFTLKVKLFDKATSFVISYFN